MKGNKRGSAEFICNKVKSSRNIISHLGVEHDCVDKFLPKDFQIEKTISGSPNKKFPDTGTKEQDKDDGLFAFKNYWNFSTNSDRKERNSSVW